MSAELSPNTQAILLLTAPLIVGSGTRSESPLSAGEYRRLAIHLRDGGRQPADLLSSDAAALIEDCGSVVSAEQLRRLLQRGFQLSQAVERWSSRSIWVMSRADATYPRRLKSRLNGATPPILYGCGDVALLEDGGLAVVGSRHVDDTLITYTKAIGALAANAEQVVVSGGARGIDQAAMRGALEEGGRVVGVLADSLEKAAVNRENRDYLMDGRLTLVSPYDPGAGFNAGHAMNRNKLVYALADAALVVSSDVNKGGTWAGAIEQLDKLRFVPVYVRSTGETNDGLTALERRGALRWPNPTNSAGVIAALRAMPPTKVEVSQVELPLATQVSEQSVVGYASAESPFVDSPVTKGIPRGHAPAEELFSKVRELLSHMLAKPKSEADVSSELGVTKTQAREWLQRLIEESIIERRGKKGGYTMKSTTSQAPTMFDSDSDSVGVATVADE